MGVRLILSPLQKGLILGVDAGNECPLRPLRPHLPLVEDAVERLPSEEREPVSALLLLRRLLLRGVGATGTLTPEESPSPLLLVATL